MAINYSNILLSKALQKYTQMGMFGPENTLSGNPDENNFSLCFCFAKASSAIAKTAFCFMVIHSPCCFFPFPTHMIEKQ
jgi:hypothetical protein